MEILLRESKGVSSLYYVTAHTVPAPVIGDNDDENCCIPVGGRRLVGAARPWAGARPITGGVRRRQGDVPPAGAEREGGGGHRYRPAPRNDQGRPGRLVGHDRYAQTRSLYLYVFGGRVEHRRSGERPVQDVFRQRRKQPAASS